MKNNELTVGELFILLTSTINAKETDMAIKLASMLYSRFEHLYVENDNLKNELKLCQKDKH